MLPDPNSTKTHSWRLLVFFPDTLHFAPGMAEVQPPHTGQANAPLRAVPRPYSRAGTPMAVGMSWELTVWTNALLIDTL